MNMCRGKLFTHSVIFSGFVLQELKELSALIYRDTSPENLGFWKNEMENAMREIAQMYEDKYGQMEVEMQSTYKTKVRTLEHFLNGCSYPAAPELRARGRSNLLELFPISVE